MGIRFEKDTLHQWQQEMAKYLRLLADEMEGAITDNLPSHKLDAYYKDYFGIDPEHLRHSTEEHVGQYVAGLEDAQLRPLALMCYYDGVLQQDKSMLRHAKALLQLHMQKTGSFSFEDYSWLSQIDTLL